MVWQWEPGTEYDYGAVVEYECVPLHCSHLPRHVKPCTDNTYKIIQPHSSQVHIVHHSSLSTSAEWLISVCEVGLDPYCYPSMSIKLNKLKFCMRSTRRNGMTLMTRGRRSSRWEHLAWLCPWPFEQSQWSPMQIGGGLLAGATSLGNTLDMSRGLLIYSLL